MKNNIKKVLVTGATGFLGKETCLYLKEKGYTVLGTGRNIAKGEELLSHNISFCKVDLTDERKVKDLVKEVDYVVHCAALSSPWGKYNLFYNNNVLATENILKACQANSTKRIIHISSPSIYFKLENILGIKENFSISKNPVNNYIKTKLMAEDLVNRYSKQNLKSIILRPQGIFGPGDPSIFPRILKTVKSKGLPTFGDNSPLTDITYVRNVAHAIYLALESDKSCNGKAYNITNDGPIELSEAIKKLLSHLKIPFKEKKLPYRLMLFLTYLIENFHKIFLPNVEPVITLYKLGVLTYSRTLDISLAKKDLGYSPIVSVDEGLDRYIKWLKKES